MLKRFSPLIIIVLLIGALVIVQLGRPGTKPPLEQDVDIDIMLDELEEYFENYLQAEIDSMLNEASDYSVCAEELLDGTPEEFEKATALFDKAYAKFKEAYVLLQDVLLYQLDRTDVTLKFSSPIARLRRSAT